MDNELKRKGWNFKNLSLVCSLLNNIVRLCHIFLSFLLSPGVTGFSAGSTHL